MTLRGDLGNDTKIVLRMTPATSCPATVKKEVYVTVVIAV